MERIRQSFVELVRDGRGSTAIEYGLVACLISITIITSATFFGTQVSSFMMTVANALGGP